MNEAKEDMENRGLFCCWQCGEFHWRENRCPYCLAGAYHQISGNTRDGLPVHTHANFIKAYMAQAKLLREKAERCELKAKLHKVSMDNKEL